MNDRTASRLAWSVWGFGLALATAACLLLWINWGTPGIANANLVFALFLAAAAVGYATVGVLIASRRRNAVGWLQLFIGTMFAMTAFQLQYGVRGLAGRGSLL